MTFTVVEAVEDRDAWLAWRRQGLGGSDVAAVLGLSPWTSPLALWADKRGLLPDKVATDAMEFGKRAEPMLAEWFHDRTGLYLVGAQSWLQRTDKPHLRATADGFVTSADLSLVPADWIDAYDAVGELKTTSDSADEWAEAIPAHYQAQATHLAVVTDLRHVTFPTLHVAFGRVQFAVHELVIGEQDAAYLEEMADAWWERHVVEGEPPEVDGHPSTTAALAALYKGEPAGARKNLDHLQGAIAKLQDAKADLKEIQVEVDTLSNLLRAELGDCTIGEVGGQQYVSWKSQTARRVDVKALRARLPRTAERFTTETTSRVLRLHEPKGRK